jgi:hypothetical protein
MNENTELRNSKYRFNDIVGSEYILPKLAEVYLITRHLLSRILLFNKIWSNLTINYNFEVEQTIPKVLLVLQVRAKLF